MIDIKSMGYIRVASTDLEAWRTFAEKVLGLAAGRGPNPDHLYYRIDEVSARIVVFPSDVDRLEVAGWEVADGPEMEAELIRWCKDRLAGYKAPTSVEFRDELARTATGKLQKFKLRAPYWEGLTRQVN